MNAPAPSDGVDPRFDPRFQRGGSGAPPPPSPHVSLQRLDRTVTDDASEPVTPPESSRRDDPPTPETPAPEVTAPEASSPGATRPDVRWLIGAALACALAIVGGAWWMWELVNSRTRYVDSPESYAWHELASRVSSAFVEAGIVGLIGVVVAWAIVERRVRA
ncbi:hypothetical protein [Agromyces atrinae]|uniref:Putative outer membrane lipoprotein n=1 Tax=Agromyces atrinae TaxID=592376 RepID=A0A4Q2MDY6_9MICO|nr:hypothetical protein [Agromyces atrinae]NYD67485.1 putative outer membrane lipoprotein [Agromyces atrinae]RXZ88292.1 hypothetical protein ESP50_03710 [Agromyces atrinae]